MRRRNLLYVTLLFYVCNVSLSYKKQFRFVRSRTVPEVEQFKRNVNSRDLEEDFDLNKDLRSVLEEVIGDTNEEPARITTKLTSRGIHRLRDDLKKRPVLVTLLLKVAILVVF